MGTAPAQFCVLRPPPQHTPPHTHGHDPAAFSVYCLCTACVLPAHTQTQEAQVCVREAQRAASGPAGEASWRDEVLPYCYLVLLYCCTAVFCTAAPPVVLYCIVSCFDMWQCTPLRIGTACIACTCLQTMMVAQGSPRSQTGTSDACAYKPCCYVCPAPYVLLACTCHSIWPVLSRVCVFCVTR